MKALNKKITDFHYGKFSAPLSLVFALGFALPAVFYHMAISTKNFLYKINFFKEKHVNLKVICVGNLTTGGVGKTPVVIELANYLSSKGKKVAILSRGYKGKLDNKLVNLVKTYNDIIIDDAELTGDEINLISKKVKDAAVITCADRYKGAKYAEVELGADVVIMDDGFSNRKIFKDFSFVLIDKTKMFGNGFCLPYGPLREPVSEIKRAQCAIIADKGGVENKNLEKFISKLEIPSIFCKMKTDKIYNIKTGELLDEGADIIAFSGIGQPEQFYKNLNPDKLKETISFDDHFEYSQKTVDEINKKMDLTGAKGIVTTEKDAVKLLKFNNIENIYALKLALDINFEEVIKD